MTFIGHSQFSLSNIDDDDLKLDFDDDENANKAKKRQLNNSQFVPPSVVQPITSTTTQKSLNKDLIENRSTSAAFDSFVVDGFTHHEQTLLELFECENDDDVNNTQFAQKQTSRMKPACSSTQISSILNNDNATVPKLLHHHQQEPELDDTTSSLHKTALKSIDNVSSVEDKQVLAEIWQYAKDHLSTLIIERHRGFLNSFSIKNLSNKFYRYYALNQNGNVIRICKVPFFYAKIKGVLSKSQNMTVILNDDSGDIMCTFSNAFLKKFIDIIRVGTVVALKDVAIVRTSLKQDGYHLNVSMENILFIYYINKADEDDSLSIQYVDVNPFNFNELVEYSKAFQNMFTLSPPTNTTSNSSTNIQNRPRPNPLPPPAASNRPNYQSNNQYQQTRPTNSSNMTAPRQQLQPQPSTTSVNTNTTACNNNQRQFRFNVNKNTQPEPPKANNTLSEEMLSQLIFGIEDELLKEDD